MGSNNHVYMAAHDAPPINFKAFIKLAMFPTGNHDILVFVTDKQVNPIHNSKAYKIKLVLVVKFNFFCVHINRKYNTKIYNAKSESIFGGYLSAGHEKPARRAFARHSRARLGVCYSPLHPVFSLFDQPVN